MLNTAQKKLLMEEAALVLHFKVVLTMLPKMVGGKLNLKHLDSIFSKF